MNRLKSEKDCFPTNKDPAFNHIALDDPIDCKTWPEKSSSNFSYCSKRPEIYTNQLMKKKSEKETIFKIVQPFFSHIMVSFTNEINDSELNFCFQTFGHIEDISMVKDKGL